MMRFLSKFLVIKTTLILSLFFSSYSFSDNHNFYEILEKLQSDIKTLEKHQMNAILQMLTSVSEVDELIKKNVDKNILQEKLEKLNFITKDDIKHIAYKLTHEDKLFLE